MASLRKMASCCVFGEFLSEFLSEALRDRLVCGLQSEDAPDPHLGEGTGDCPGMEAALKNTLELKDDSPY